MTREKRHEEADKQVQDEQFGIEEPIEQAAQEEQIEPIEQGEQIEQVEQEGQDELGPIFVGSEEEMDEWTLGEKMFEGWMEEDFEMFNKAMLGHDESLNIGDKKVVGAVVKRLAEDMELVRKFKSVNILHSKNKGFLACVNLLDKGLYINASNDMVSASDLVRTIKGLVLHECFVGDSIVTMADGSGKRIEDIHMDLKNGKEVFVKTFDVEKRAFTVKPVLASFEDSSESLLGVFINGKKVSVTGNHPFLVLDNGVPFWKRADELKKGDEVVADKDRYRPDNNNYIGNRYDVTKTLDKWNRKLYDVYHVRKLHKRSEKSDAELAGLFGVDRHTVHRFYHDKVIPFGERVIRELEEKGLLPFVGDGYKTNAVARVVGYLFGNGWLTSTRKVVGFGCTTREDAELLLDDLRFIGFEGKFRPVNCSVVVESPALWHFLQAFGVPVGKRTEQAFSMPGWVLNLDWQGRRNFLAGLFGSDGSKPFFQKKSPNPIRLRFSKQKEYIRSLSGFMVKIRELLSDFGVYSVVSKPYKNDRKMAIELMVVNGSDNIRRFVEQIGYAYSVKGKSLAGKTLEFLLMKKGERQRSYHVSGFNDFAYRFSFSSSDIGVGRVERVVKKRVKRAWSVFNLSVAGTNNYLVGGVVVKNCGHLSSLFAVPGSKEKGKKDFKAVQKAKADPGVLNWVYDLEIHYQANERKVFTPGDQLELRDFLSATRAALERVEPTSPLLCMEQGPKTKFQKKVKVIIDDRNKSVVKKAIEISKLWDKEGPKQPGEGKCSCKQGKGKGQGEHECEHCKNARKGRKLTVVVVDKEQMDKLAGKHHKVENITKRIEKESDFQKLQERCRRTGVSAGTLSETVRYFESKGDALEHMEELAKSLEDMLKVDSGFLRSTVSEEKTGSRLNGIRPMRDIHEITENVEQLVTDGRYDIEDIRVPRKIKRKLKGYVFIIRDVSGSIADGSVSKVVRDTTMYLISECKKAKHKVCVIDFDTSTYTLADKKGKEISESYDEMLCKSSYLKVGGGTTMGVAIDKLNMLIHENKLADVPINVYIITDSEIMGYHTCRNKYDTKNFGNGMPIKNVRVNHRKFGLTGLVYNEGGGHRVDGSFKEFISKNGGKTFFICLDDTKKLVKELKAVS